MQLYLLSNGMWQKMYHTSLCYYYNIHYTVVAAAAATVYCLVKLICPSLY